MQLSQVILLNTSQMLLPLSHWPHGRGAAHKVLVALCGDLSNDSLCLSGKSI